MTQFLIKKFVKDYSNTNDKTVRHHYGMLGSVVGIVCNIFLFASKLLSGLVLNSVSVIADAFNNLSDAGSAIVTLIGFKLASKPPDREHPFGHGRFEYISGLIVSFIIMLVGLEFLKSSVQKIFNPQKIEFSVLSLAILIMSIFVKLWLSMFNKKVGKIIGSKAMEATSMDSLSDVLATSATIVSVIVTALTGKVIDGYIGAVVACIVLFAGYNIAKDTLEPLIGTGIDPELAKNIHDMVLSYEGIEGVHDLIVHNYGPGRSMASLHAEVPANVNIQISHEIIDKIEKEVAEKLNVFLVIHMDPITMNDERVTNIKKSIVDIVKAIDSRLNIHDFRIVDGQEQINIIFDLVVPRSYSDKQKEELEIQVSKLAKIVDNRYNCVICVESSYIME